MDINGAVAVVSGGASGLGEAVVRAVVARGGKAMILDRDAERGVALVEELGASVGFHRTDVTCEEDVSAAITQTVDVFGKVSISMACAGIVIGEKTVGRDGPHALESFKRVIDINLNGTFNLARLAAHAMQTNAPNADGERGVIINTASIAAYEGQKGQPAYASSKGGVAGLTLPMARDLAQQGIRVNAIAPGLIQTPMVDGLPEEARAELATQPVFPKRFGRPEEIGHLVCFLIENAYMNGETVRIDGGIRLP